jgi:hypothetical protein
MGCDRAPLAVPQNQSGGKDYLRRDRFALDAPLWAEVPINTAELAGTARDLVRTVSDAVGLATRAPLVAIKRHKRPLKRTAAKPLRMSKETQKLVSKIIA